MGYHIINNSKDNLNHEYVETFEQLAFFDCIKENTIIFEGEKHLAPVRVGSSEKYKSLSLGWFRAGIQAQEIFKRQATQNGYILEELNQDQKSFKSYTSNANSIPIKRGDFLLRNCGNIEIDVKCRSFIPENGEIYFDFKCEDAEKHLNMISFTNTPILIAVYKNRNDSAVDNDFYMFDINKLVKNKEIKKHFRTGIGNCYRIPLSFTRKGFELIELTSKKINKKNKLKAKEYSVNEKRKADSNAYMKWTKEEDEELELMYCEKKTIHDLSKHFGRNIGAIHSRIKKLELKQKYDFSSNI